MSNNIKHEAVFPPAVHNLRRMSHLSPTRNGANGSYELYNPNQKNLDSPEKKIVNSSDGTAPGSPRPQHEYNYNQVIEKLQRELEESKEKESDLQKMLADLKNPLGQANTAFLETSFLEESPSDDSIGENVKDAHIRHLQRQVTVLQATLYKSEGWSNRVAAAVRERDKALDEVAHLTIGIRDMQENNHQLLRKIESLNTALQEAHKNLQLAREQLQNNNYNGQFVSQLKDEIQRQKCEITTLKESLSRLDMENRSLKDPSVDASAQSLGNVVCSQELEHLHKVVDRLKSSVLEQRSYLLHLRQPNNGNSAKSLSTSSAFATTDIVLDQDTIAGKNSTREKLRGATVNSLGSEIAQGLLSQHVMIGQPSQAVSKPGTSKENLQEIQLSQHHNNNDFVLDNVAGTRRKLNSREMLEDTFKMDVLNSQNLLPAQGGGLLGMESRYVPQMTNRNGYSYSTPSQNPHGYIGQQFNADTAMQNLGSSGLAGTTGYDLVKSSQERIQQNKSSHSEPLGSRTGEEGVSKGKSDAVGWPVRQWNLASANNSAAAVTTSASEYKASFAQEDLRLNPNQRQRYQPTRSTIQAQETQGKSYEAGLIPAETQGQFVLNGNGVHINAEYPYNNELRNFSQKSVTSQPKQIYHPPSGYQEGSVQMSNYNVMAGGQMTIPAPPAHRPGTAATPAVVYVNTSGNKEVVTTNIGSSSNTGSSQAKNSERFCPVCSNNYSHVSMEEFQDHIFDCFDSENPPETMKPNVSQDRSCPVCYTFFGPTVSQTEYEKHVHNHFGEEGPGDNFEILQP